MYSSGEYLKAAEFELKDHGGEKPGTSYLLQKLQAAAALRHAKEYEKSTKLFDESEDIIKYFNEKNVALSTTASVMLNDTVLDYRGEEFDGIMVNTYKALNFWKLGKKDLARVEFNRALDRQRRAKERFAKEIADMKEDLQKKQAKEDKKARAGNLATVNIDKTVNNPEIDRIIGQKYSNLNDFETYPDFINPFTTYLAGLFFMADRDNSKASTLLKEAYGMVGNNPTVADDFAIIERILDGKKLDEKFIWVIFENGLGPVRQEYMVNLPIIVTKRAVFTGVALPKLKLRRQAYPYLYISGDGKRNKKVKTKMLASMDRIVQTEFKKDYPAIVTRAVTSTLLKTYAQYLAEKKYGSAGMLTVLVYQVATTAADIRIWTALPKNFQLAKIKSEETGLVTISAPDGQSVTAEVPKGENCLIYVKIPKAGIGMTYDVIKF